MGNKGYINEECRGFFFFFLSCQGKRCHLGVGE